MRPGVSVREKEREGEEEGIAERGNEGSRRENKTKENGKEKKERDEGIAEREKRVAKERRDIRRKG